MRTRAMAGAVLIVVGFALAASSLPTVLGQGRAVASYRELADETAPAVDPNAIDWESLLATNPSLVAWCRVEGTSIDLPVCQATDEEPEHWLTHDFWGGESPAGTPYVDHRATKSSRHLICYGHHLTGIGGMFSDVYRCHEQAEFDGWLTGDLVWSTPDGSAERLHPLCASLQDMGYDGIQRFEFDEAPDLHAWLQTVLARSSAVAPDASSLAATASRAITLVTCGSDLSGRRERTLVTFVA